MCVSVSAVRSWRATRATGEHRIEGVWGLWRWKGTTGPWNRWHVINIGTDWLGQIRIRCFTVEFHLSEANNHPQQPTVVCNLWIKSEFCAIQTNKTISDHVINVVRQAYSVCAQSWWHTGCGGEEDVEESSERGRGRWEMKAKEKGRERREHTSGNNWMSAHAFSYERTTCPRTLLIWLCA